MDTRKLLPALLLGMVLVVANGSTWAAESSYGDHDSVQSGDQTGPDTGGGPEDSGGGED